MKTYETCDDVREEFSALLDGELASDEQDGVEHHLAECSDCLRELDGFKRVNDLYAGMPAVGAPDDFEIDLTEGDADSNIVDLQSAVRESHPVSFRPVLAAVAMLALLAGVSYTASQMLAPGEQMEMAAETAASSAIVEEASADFAEDGLGDSVNQLRAPMPQEVVSPPEAESFADVAGTSGGRARAADEPAELQKSIEEKVVAEPPVAAAPKPALSITDTAEARQAPALDALGFALTPDGIWYEEGYADQPITVVKPGSDEAAELLKTRPELTVHLLATDKIVFKSGDTWYRVSERDLDASN